MAYVILGSKPVGSIVKLKENGVPIDYLVVHQGLPSSLYDVSCDGTWLLRKDAAEKCQWNSGQYNRYASSSVHIDLNNTYIYRFDAVIRAAIKQVKIPYGFGDGTTGGASGVNGLSCQLFLLAACETGCRKNSALPADGDCLAFFLGTGVQDMRRICYLNGTAVIWWVRTPAIEKMKTFLVETNGGYGENKYCDRRDGGLRPALILPSTIYVDDAGSVTVNTAPGIPASIGVPGSINGGTNITVSWGAAGDAEGNIAGYIVERSDNGGSAWAQIYQGGAMSTVNYVTYGTPCIMYRVKAYDSGGLHSSYQTSDNVIVTNNVAPGAPAGINVPLAVDGGKSITVSWGGASDANGNFAGYALERSVNGAAFGEIWRGNALSRVDAITKGWGTVAYRVRAYDSDAAYGPYAASATLSVNNNTPPVILCASANGSSLGKRAAGFTIAYSVTDAENDAVTVTESMDGEVKRTYMGTLGASNSFVVTDDYFMRLLNGAHTMAVTVNDGKLAATHTLLFEKSVTAAKVTLSAPMCTDAPITLAALSVSGVIQGDAHYSVSVTNNAKDAAPVWEDITEAVQRGANHIFANKTAAKGYAFNFLIAVSRGASGQGGYITSIQGGYQ